jgi:hypothetical protein
MTHYPIAQIAPNGNLKSQEIWPRCCQFLRNRLLHSPRFVRRLNGRAILHGQLETFAFNFCPKGWAALNGQLLPINTNTALFALLGTTYGGDGKTTFALPTAKPIFTATGAPVQQCIALQGIFPPRN